MRSLLALLFLSPLAARGDDVEKVQSDLGVAFRAYDRVGANRASEKLAKLNSEACPQAFLADFKIGLETLTEIKKEQRKWAGEMAANELYRDSEGRLVSRGDGFKFLAAKQKHDLLIPKIEMLDSTIPHSMANMSRLSSAEAEKGLEEILRTSPDWLPRAAAADALAGMKDPAALAALLARAKSEESPGVRVAIAGALGIKGTESEEARKILSSWLANEFWQVRLSAEQAIARTGDKKMTPLLINQLRTAQGRLKIEFNECLKTLTGVNKHADYAAWKAWWEKNNEQILDGTYKVQVFEQVDDKGLTNFYGIRFNSSRVIFLLDVSDSMKEDSKWKPDVANDNDKLDGKRKIDVARYELRKIIRGLPDGAAFNIIGFSGFVTVMSEKMLAADKKSRENAVKFIQNLQLLPGTNTHGALCRALDFTGGDWNAPLTPDSVDTFYLISDGVPASGIVTDSQWIVERIVDALRYKKIVIHSVFIDPSFAGKTVMKGVAAGTGGQYVER